MEARQTEDHSGTVDFILQCIKGDRFKDAMGQTAEWYVRYSLGQSAHLYHAEGFADVAMERDMQEAWNTRLVAAIDLLLEHADDFTDDALLVRRSDVRGLREVRRDG